MKKFVLTLIYLTIGTLLMQGFQCASPEYQTAKLALKNKEYTKAEEFLEKELNRNNQNGEAWIFLAETKWSLKKYKESADCCVKAEKYIGKDPKLSFQLSMFRAKQWREMYSNSIDYLNSYINTKNKVLADSSLQAINIGLTLRPEIADFYSLRGTVYDAMGEQSKAISAYLEYYKEMEESINLAKEKVFYQGALRSEVIKNLGKPTQSEGFRYNAKSDSIIYDVFTINGKELTVFSTDKSENVFKVRTWKYNYPATLPASEKTQPFDIQLNPFATLTQYYYDQKNNLKSLEFLNVLLTLDPSNVDANRFLVTLYEAMGKKDEATKRVEELVKKNPDNKNLRLQYGDILQQMEKYDDAIKQYEEALRIDNNYIDVMRNLAAAYKNKAVIIQKKQIDDLENKRISKINPSEFEPYLKKSADNFEKIKKYPKFANDIDVMVDLSEIYFALNEQDNFKYSVQELVNIEEIVPQAKKEKYYLSLFKIYDQRLQDKVKADVYKEKYEKINK